MAERWVWSHSEVPLQFLTIWQARLQVWSSYSAASLLHYAHLVTIPFISTCFQVTPSPLLPSPSTLHLLTVTALVCSGEGVEAERVSQRLIDSLLPRATAWLQDSEGVKGEGVEGEGVLSAVMVAKALYLGASASRGRGRLREACVGYERCRSAHLSHKKWPFLPFSLAPLPLRIYPPLPPLPIPLSPSLSPHPSLSPPPSLPLPLSPSPPSRV